MSLHARFEEKTEMLSLSQQLYKVITLFYLYHNCSQAENFLKAMFKTRDHKLNTYQRLAIVD